VLGLDPGWLLSSIAQSTAALVAIVGGFLVSRLITLASERAAAERQARDLGRRVDFLSDVAQNRQELVLEIDARRVLASGNARRRLIDSRGEVDATELIESERRSGLTAELFEKDLAPIRECIRDAFPAIESMYQFRPPHSLQDALGRYSKDLTEYEALWFELVFWNVSGRLRAADPTATPRMGGSDLRLPREAFDDVARQRWDQQLRDRDEAEQQVRAASDALLLAQAEVSFLIAPTNVWRSFWVLVYFAGVGLVLPLLVLAFGPTKLHWTLRALICLLFVSGLAALLDLFARIIRATAPSSQTP
jgi:hypothetical protein